MTAGRARPPHGRAGRRRVRSQATERAMTTTNTPSTATKNELLRELIIATGCVAMLLSGVGALYWIQTRPDEATAGATVTTAAKAGGVKPTEVPKPQAGVPTPDAAVTPAHLYFGLQS